MKGQHKLTAKQNLLQLWLRLHADHRSLICAQIYDSSEISSLSYWLEIVFSAGIATFGLVLNSPAVIIGAMLISPMMSPIMATGLSLAVGDLYLAIKAVAGLLSSIAAAICLSTFFVWLLPFHSVTEEILARTKPNLLDLAIALFSGLAGSVAVSRSVTAKSGVTALPGVAIAVALMPPLCTMGFGLGNGADLGIMSGAGLLFLTNLVAIVASAFFVFLLIGMNSPEIRAQMERSRRGEWLAERLSASPISQALLNAGQLRWRVLMLVILLGAIAVPLRQALLQLSREAVGRTTVQEVLAKLVPSSSMVSQQVEVGRGSVLIRLVSTSPVPDARLRAAESEIRKRSGLKAQITIASIASQSELALLLQKLSAPPLRPPEEKPAEKSIASLQSEIVRRFAPVVTDVWPREMPLQDFDVAMNQAGIILNVRYLSSKALQQVTLDILTRELREKLDVPELSLDATMIAPPSVQQKKANRR